MWQDLGTGGGVPNPLCVSREPRVSHAPGPRIAAGGPAAAGVNGDALFEIGSTIKVFTTLLPEAPLLPRTLRSVSPLTQKNGAVTGVEIAQKWAGVLR